MSQPHLHRAPANFGRVRHVHAAIERLFDCLAVHDFLAAAQLWDPPALVLGDTHVHGMMSISQIQRLLADTAVNGHEPWLNGTIRIEQLEWQSERVVQTRVRWTAMAFDGVLRGVSGGIFVMRFDEVETPKIRGLLLLPEGFPRAAPEAEARSVRGADF
jgi:hypothetical protein